MKSKQEWAVFIKILERPLLDVGWRVIIMLNGNASLIGFFFFLAGVTQGELDTQLCQHLMNMVKTVYLPLHSHYLVPIY